MTVDILEVFAKELYLELENNGFQIHHFLSSSGERLPCKVQFDFDDSEASHFGCRYIPNPTPALSKTF
jgi:hypothetical protein